MSRNKNQNQATVEDYINHLLTGGFLGNAAPNKHIELATEFDAGATSIIFEGVRVYFRDGVIDPGVGMIQFQAPVFKDFIATPELTNQVAHTSKVLLSVELVDIGGGKSDLVISADLLFTGESERDAFQMAIYLMNICSAHEQLYDSLEGI